jgi:hypothetical protein
MLQYSGRGANLDEIRLATGRLLFWETGDPKASVSRRWAKAWMTRQADFLKGIKEKPLSAKRLAAHIVEDVQGHFAEFDRYRRRYGVKDYDVSNFDETGFQIGVITGGRVYVSLDCEAIYKADPENRELVTAVATINYGATKVPAMIIFKGAYHLRGYFKNDLDDNILFTRSATGFSNQRLGVCYIRHFDRFCPPSRPGRYRILIFDSHGSHISREFLDYCWQHRIRPYKLPAYTTHLLQPLDVAIFQSLKHWFQVELRREIFMGAESVDKKAFFAMFQRFWDRVFSSGTIARNSFLKTRLIPLNAEVVLSKMKEYKQLKKQEKRRARTPTPPTSPVRQDSPILPSSPLAFATPLPRTSPPQTDWANWATPLTIRTRKKDALYVKERMEAAMKGIPITPSVLQVQEKIEGAAERSMLSGALAKQRVHDLGIAEQERAVREAPDNRRVVQKYGEIYVYQARADIAADDEDEAKVVNLRDARLARPWKKAYKKMVESFGDEYIKTLDCMRHWEHNLWD